MNLRVGLVLLVAALAAGSTWLAHAADPVPLSVGVLKLDDSNAARTTVGKLVWRGGLVLRGRHVDFGGYSGLAIGPNGTSLRAVSDTGTWLTLDLLYDANAMLMGAGNALTGVLHDTAGKRLLGKANTDAESMSVLGDGSVLIGFEQRHRLWRYPAGSEARGGGLAGNPVAIDAPSALMLAPSNGGLEAIALLGDGRILLLTEDMRRGNAIAGWIGVPQGRGFQWQNVNYVTTGIFRPSDAATLPNGDVIVLERSFNLLEGVRVRVMRLRKADIVAEATLRAEELAVLESPVITENLEGVSAGRGANGEMLLWLISDDNFNPLQRTVLLHFAIAD